MRKWINASKKLPDDGSNVWCLGTYEGYDVFGFEGYYDSRSRRWFAINNGDYVDGGYGANYEAEVTHWLPLPIPPESK